MKLTLSQMKSMAMTLVIVLLVSAVGIAQVTIWGGPGDPDGEFANGLGNWTTSGSATNGGTLAPDPDAVFVWDMDGTMDQGSFWGAAGALNSPSIANGCAGFDSDFNDNNGVGVFGSGPAPAPQIAMLTSPSFDCSANSTVWVMFNQSYRNFQSETFLEVSTNGGTSFDSIYTINADVPVNRSQGVSANTVQFVDITGAAAGQADVQIRFRFAANYYYWMIDDVWVVEAPEKNVGLSDDFFYPLGAKVTPAAHIPCDSMGFNCDIYNLGTTMAQDVVCRVEILFDDGNPGGMLMYSDSVEVGPIAAGTMDSVIVFDGLYGPNLGVGDYFVRYSIEDRGAADFNGFDNSKIEEFIISETLFSLEDDNNPSQAFAAGSAAPWGWGASYVFCEDAVEDFMVESVSFGSVSNDDMTGRVVEVYILEVPTVYPDDWYGTGTPALFDDAPDHHIIKAFGNYQYLNNDERFDVVTVSDFIDWTTLEDIPIVLEKGKRYVVLPYYGGNNTDMFQTVSQETNYFGAGRTVIWDEEDGAWFSGFTDGENLAPHARLNLAISTSIDETPLPDEAVQVFPNPASDILNVGLDLAEASDITITLADITGRVITAQNHANIEEGNFNFDVSKLAAGTYIVRVATLIGTKTTKFVVQ